MLRIPHCLDSRLTEGREVVSPTHRPHSTPRKHFLVLISVRGCAYPRAMARLEGLYNLIKFIHLIESRSRDLPACSTMVKALPCRLYANDSASELGNSRRESNRSCPHGGLRHGQLYCTPPNPPPGQPPTCRFWFYRYGFANTKNWN
jgi:hypothetical protein